MFDFEEDGELMRRYKERIEAEEREDQRRREDRYRQDVYERH